MYNVQCWNCGHSYDYDRFLGCCPDCGALESDNPVFHDTDDNDIQADEFEEPTDDDVPFEDEHEEIDDDDTF